MQVLLPVVIIAQEHPQSILWMPNKTNNPKKGEASHLNPQAATPRCDSAASFDSWELHMGKATSTERGKGNFSYIHEAPVIATHPIRIRRD